MNALRCVVGSVLIAGWALAVCGEAAAQGVVDPDRAQAVAERGEWEQRALRRSQPITTREGSSTPRVASRWSPSRRGEPLRVAQAVPPDAEEVPLPAEQGPMLRGGNLAPFDPLAGMNNPYAPEMGGPMGDACDDCGDCGDVYGFDGYRHDCVLSWLRNFSLFAGVQGFKGPSDLGGNGNFGFHEGFNFGAPLGDPWGFGYQFGFQAVHSNFSGSLAPQSSPSGGETFSPNGPDARNQLFFTGGVFRRAVCGGLQGGVVFDYMHDNFFNKTDLMQIRSETSYLFGDWHELGYFGNYSSSRDRLNFGRNGLVLLEPNDIFSLFYRRHFTGGGQGRVWGGISGKGEGVFGAEATVPLGTSWALENNFIYVVPKHGQALGGQQEESWSVSIGLVWYPGRNSRCVLQEPFQPLQSVADNTYFIIRRSAP